MFLKVNCSRPERRSALVAHDLSLALMADPMFKTRAYSDLHGHLNNTPANDKATSMLELGMDSVA